MLTKRVILPILLPVRRVTTAIGRTMLGGAMISRQAMAICMLAAFCSLSSCVREPDLHLHGGGGDVDIDLPIVDLDLSVLWDYLFQYDVKYDWQKEWLYGWDETDVSLFGPIGYAEPDAFDIRRYFTHDVPLASHTAPYSHLIKGNTLSATYDFGYWDVLAWNDIQTPDGIQSVRIDETTSYDYVIAYTGETMIPTRYNAPKFTRAFYQPEELFAGYEAGIEISRDLTGFVYDENRCRWVRQLNMELQPVTYIYLVQVVLHNNNSSGRRVTSIDGTANLSGMSRSVTLNTGVTGNDAITVNFGMRMKFDRPGKDGEMVDIIGGKVMTFGMPGLNPHKLNPRSYMESLLQVAATDTGNRHYLDVNMQFYNGKDSTIVFDVTDQVRRLYRGGVITLDLDMNKVPVPNQKGGSGFDAVVKDFEEKEWEFEM